MEYLLKEPWPWYAAGPLIALTLMILLLLGKTFGMSSNLRTACAAMGAGKASDFFKFDWKSQRWNLLVVLGAIIGGWIAATYMSTSTVAINPQTAAQLATDYGITSAGTAYLPPEIFASVNLTSLENWLILIGGGFLVGFGARYAGGCTSGHAITGLSNLQLPSLVAVIGFFIGGLVMINWIYPLIF